MLKETFQQRREDRLRNEILIPLLKAMGYNDVKLYHGNDEQGKDIVFWNIEQPLGRRRNFAIVAKAGNISGSAKISGEVSTQVLQCFAEPFLDSTTLEKCQVNECWVVTNGQIKPSAEKAIRNTLVQSGLLYGNVQFIGGDGLWSLVEKHLERIPILQKAHEVQKALKGISPNYQAEIHLTHDQISVGFGEKFPGASVEEPFKFEAVIGQDAGEEGAKVKEALENHFLTGEPVEIPGEYIKVQIPDFMKELMGVTGQEVHSLRLGPITKPESILAKVELSCDDGDYFCLEYVDFKVSQLGTHEIILTNQEQPIAIKLKVTLKPVKSEWRLNASFSDSRNLNVKQLTDVALFQSCFSKPFTISLTHLDTGIEIVRSHLDNTSNTNPKVEDNVLETMQDLVAIQVKTQTLIVLPDRDLTQEEVETVATLRSVLHQGAVYGEWNFINIPCSFEQAKKYVEEHHINNIQSITVIQEGQEIELFGCKIPMGKTKMTVPEAVLNNVSEVIEAINQAEELNDYEATIVLNLIPGSNPQGTLEYLDWQQ